MKWLLLAVALSGCNPTAALWVRIEAPFEVPRQVDRLSIKATRVSDRRVVYESTPVIQAAFPHTLSLTTSDEKTVGEVEVEVKAMLGANTVSTSSAVATLERDQFVDVTVRLCDCAK